VNANNPTLGPQNYMRRVPASKDSLPYPCSATQMRPKVALSQHVDGTTTSSSLNDLA